MKRSSKTFQAPRTTRNNLISGEMLSKTLAVAETVADVLRDSGEKQEKASARTRQPGYLSYQPLGEGKGYESPSDWVSRLKRYSADINPEFRCPAALVDLNPSRQMTCNALKLMHFILASCAHAKSKKVSLKKGVLSDFLGATTPRVVDAIRTLNECLLTLNAISVKSGSKPRQSKLLKNLNVGRYTVFLELSDPVWLELRNPSFFAFVDLQVVRSLKSTHAILLTPLASLLSILQRDTRFKLQRHTNTATGAHLSTYSIEVWPSEFMQWLGYTTNENVHREPARLVKSVSNAQKQVEKGFGKDAYAPSFSARPFEVYEGFKRDLSKPDKTKLKITLRPAARNEMYEFMNREIYEQFNLSAPKDLYISPKRFIALLDALHLDVSADYLEAHMNVVQLAWKHFLYQKYLNGVAIEPINGSQLISEFIDECLNFGIQTGQEDQLVAAELAFEDLVFGRLKPVSEADETNKDNLGSVLTHHLSETSREIALEGPVRRQRRDANVLIKYRIKTSGDGKLWTFNDVVFEDRLNPKTKTMERTRLPMSDVVSGKVNPQNYAFRQVDLTALERSALLEVQMLIERQRGLDTDNPEPVTVTAR